MNKEEKPVVLLDLDDTSNNFGEVFWHTYNTIHNDHVKLEDVTDWDLSKSAKPEIGSKVYNLFKKPGLFRYLKPYDDAVDVVNRILDNGIDIIVVSDSPAGTSHCDRVTDYKQFSNPADDKRKWVMEHFPRIPKEHIILTSIKWQIIGDVLIDDKPDTFLKFQEKGRACILIDKPYNRHIKTKWRASNLTQAESMLYEILRNMGKFR